MKNRFLALVGGIFHRNGKIQKTKVICFMFGTYCWLGVPKIQKVQIITPPLEFLNERAILAIFFSCSFKCSEVTSNCRRPSPPLPAPTPAPAPAPTPASTSFLDLPLNAVNNVLNTVEALITVIFRQLLPFFNPIHHLCLIINTMREKALPLYI